MRKHRKKNAKKCENFAKKIMSKFREKRKRKFIKKDKIQLQYLWFSQNIFASVIFGKKCEILRKVCKIQRNFFSAKLFVGYKLIVEMGLVVNERNISKQTKYYGERWCYVG